MVLLSSTTTPSSSSTSPPDAFSPWTQVKSLSAVVESAILHRQPGLKYDLEVALRKFKPQFIALLKNPSRSPSDADLVRKAQTEGIRYLPLQSSSSSTSVEASSTSESGLQRLPPQVAEEALIIAEMFNLNEIAALQLLLKGEEQLNQYPGLTRGLVSVLLYYDSRKSLVQSLRTLIQGREGIAWTLELSEDISELVTQFTRQLLEEGLVEKILNLLQELEWSKEVLVLQKNMALGDAKHRRQVHDLFADIRQSLADSIFCFAAQSGLPKADTLRLLDFLSKVKPGETTGSGVIDNTTLTLLMALLYSVDISALHKSEDGERAVESLPLLSDPTYVPTLHRELGPAMAARLWANPALQSVAQFAWAMTVASLRSLPQNQAYQTVLDDDETIMDLALDNSVFHHLPSFILASETLRTEEFYIRRLHQLLTDFIVLMPLKVKELRNRADDSARNNLMHEQEGIHYSVPLLGQHFEYLLASITSLYQDDSLRLGLALEYWCPTEGNNGMMERFPQRQVSLYKFVRLAGDLLMPSLYTPYIKLLTSLSNNPQSALHCFNLLKLNGMSGGGSGGQQGSNTAVSWDHFFNSLQQYFANLKQDAPLSAPDTIYRMGRPLSRGISPAEIRGLAAVLGLIQEVCRNCEAARVAIAENSSWQPLLVIVGLLGCPVPTVLKAELLKTLASLAKSADITDILWQNVEAAQLINTTPGPLGSQRNGLSTELENVETRNEEYPMTRSFLLLIDMLTDNSIPGNLGTGTRAPGFEPYLNFIRDSIFLRFNTRSYKDPSEKWQVAAGCLKIFCKLITEYSPSPNDFLKEVGSGAAGTEQHPTSGKHPGFLLMVQLLQSSELLRILLYILDEGCTILETYQPFPGKKALESSCLLCLRIFDSTLARQFSFLEAAKTANTSLILTPLHQLLQGVNPRSGRPDHMLNVCKFVTFSWWLPNHTLLAVRILMAVADSPSAQPGLLATLNSSEAVGRSIIKGFTDVLDNDEEEVEEEDLSAAAVFESASVFEDDPDVTDAAGLGSCRNKKSIGAARISIVQLLLNGLDKPAPSISHFLLGFDMRRGSGIGRCTLQPPGVLGAIRTPFHAILSILRPTGAHTPSPANSRAPQLCEASFKLVYFLAANHLTSEPVLRYLRSSEDFLSSQLALLPLRVVDTSSASFNQVTRGVSWLLKTVAIELKLVSAARLRSQVGLVVGMLLSAAGGEDAPSRNLDDSSILGGGGLSTLTQLSRSVVHSTRGGGGGGGAGGSAGSGGTASMAGQQQHRLLQILNAIDFSEGSMQSPQWEMFDASQVSQVLLRCETVLPTGEKTIDIPALHKILNQELNSLQGATALSQRQIIHSEIKSILVYAVRWNHMQEQALTKKSILDAWRQVTEVMLCSVPNDILSAASKQQLLLDLLQSLLNKILADGTMPELANQVSGVVLLLLTALRQTYASDCSSSSAISTTSTAATGQKGHDTFVNILDSVDQVKKPNVYSTALHAILKGLLMWINSTNASAQRVRSNLYGALLNYLRIGKDEGANKRSAKLELSDQAKFRKANLEILSDFGDNFLDILCRDTVCGHDIRRMLALSVIDELVLMDGRGTWTFYMSNQGYLRHIIESFTVEDENLIQLLTPDPPENLRMLYTYESKMAMLTRMASTVAGAEILLESRLLVRLSEMTVFSSRPDVSPNSALDMETDAFLVPSPLARYHQILFPALRICQALLASLGSQNRSATSQVNHFLTCNEELVRSVLKSRGIWSLPQLQELSLLTGLISRSVAFDSTFAGSSQDQLDSAADLEVAAHATRLQRQMLSLIPHFDPSDELMKQIKKNIVEKNQDDAVRCVLEINANVMMFARNIVSKSMLDDARSSVVIFAPTLNEAQERADFEDRYFTQISLPSRPPSLGNVILLVRHLSKHLISTHSVLRDLSQKMQCLQQLSSAELSTFIGPAAANSDKLGMADKRAIAGTTMKALAEGKEHEARLAETAVECASFLALKHLEHFFLVANADHSMTSYQKAHRRLIGHIAPSDIAGDFFPDTLPLETIEKLKEDARTCLNESFYLILEDVERVCQGKKKNDVGGSRFLDIVIRRLKRLSSLHT